MGFNLERWRSWDLSPARLHRISTGSRETGPTGQRAASTETSPSPAAEASCLATRGSQCSGKLKGTGPQPPPPPPVLPQHWTQ